MPAIELDPSVPTPDDLLVDPQGRPYFLWDVEVCAYLAGKLMRQARPGDVYRFVTEADIRTLWPLLERYLGRTRATWRERLQVDETQHHDDG